VEFRIKNGAIGSTSAAVVERQIHGTAASSRCSQGCRNRPQAEGAIGSINQWGPFARLTGVVLARSVLFYGLRLWARESTCH